MSPAAEWLLDNFHIISAAARDIHHDLPPAFFKRLPRIAADEFAGLPRIYALALELIGSSAGRLDAQRLQRFISAFQSMTPLTMGELWAWPSALKLALLDHLRMRGDVLAATRAHRSPPIGWPRPVEAARLARPMAGARPPCVRHPAAPALAAARRHRLGPAPSARGGAGRARPDDRGRHPGGRTAPGGRTGRHGEPDWQPPPDFDVRLERVLRSVSLVEQVLQRVPAGVYGRMDFRSRDRYRHAIEELAGRPARQLLLALKSVERARQMPSALPTPATHTSATT